MEKYIIIFGITLCIYNLGVKLGFWYFMERLSGRATNKLLFSLMQCPWCMMFHVSWILTIIYGMVCGFEIYLITLPLVNAGLLTLKISNNG